MNAAVNRSKPSVGTLCKCRSARSRVYRTTPRPNGTVVRIRLCLTCGRPRRTVER